MTASSAYPACVKPCRSYLQEQTDRNKAGINGSELNSASPPTATAAKPHSEDSSLFGEGYAASGRML